MADSPIPAKMRAWTFSKRGTPDKVLHLAHDIPVPTTPSGSKILVHVAYVGLSSAGFNLMGNIPSVLRKKAVPEIDFSGHVVACGPNSPPEMTPGTAIFGTVPLSGHLFSGQGAMAEYIAVPADCVAVKPENFGLAEASGLNSLGQTALCMIEKAKLKSGDIVLVHGGGGDVGMIAIQALKALGAHVVATCSERKMETVKNLGADEVVDYQQHEPIFEHLASRSKSQHFDAILDAVGTQALFDNSPKYLKQTGTFVCVGTEDDGSQFQSLLRLAKNSLWPAFLGGTPRRFITFGAAISHERLMKLASLVEDGKIKIVVDSTFSMEDALKAYEHKRKRGAAGKVVIQIAT